VRIAKSCLKDRMSSLDTSGSVALAGNRRVYPEADCFIAAADFSLGKTKTKRSPDVQKNRFFKLILRRTNEQETLPNLLRSFSSGSSVGVRL
jgi:hypothetical protein